MATTETGDGHQHVSTNQVSSPRVAGAVTEAADGEAMEEQPDVGEAGPGSPPELSEQADEGTNRAAAEEDVADDDDAGEKKQHEETDANEVKSEGSESSSRDFKIVVSSGDGSGDTPEPGKDGKQEECEAMEENGVLQDRGAEESPSGEDAEIGTEDAGGSVDPETDAKRDATGCKDSQADDLDEMMDIGTVDQVEQEAQMKDDEGSGAMDMESSASPAGSNSAEEKNAIKEELEEKPTSLDLMQYSPPPAPDATSRTGRDDSSSPAETALNGTNVVKLPRPETEEPERASPSPPLVHVKDEPVDEEYDQALTSSTASVKDESAREEDLRIGSVFSVPPAAEPMPIVKPSSSQMFCPNCKKGLLKGQTAYQRKGSQSLFCSTTCLTACLPPAKGASKSSNKICSSCQKLIFRPQDVILAPDAKGTMRDFCSQSCLNHFNRKKSTASYRKAAAAAAAAAATKALLPIAPQPICSMCSRACVSKHEVILSGAVHKICSDACFDRFRAVNNLSMAGCANCGSFCHIKPVMLKLEDSSKTLCNAECLAAFKEKTKITQPCTMCQTTHLLAEMVDNKNTDDSVNLFCSSSCVMAYKVQTVSSSGARLNCDSCGKNSVPAYHLAMSDTSIRNFCNLPCVMAFQDKFKKTQKQVNVFTKLPVGSAQIQSATAAGQTKQDAKAAHKLNCFHCSQKITFKPEIIQIKDQIVFLCSSDCSHEYKKANYIVSVCDHCKVEKITRDVKRINNKDCYFCSDGCRLLYRHDLSKTWGKHCYSCVYCHCASKKLVTAQYGGSAEEFCSEECRSKYTMLFCHVAKCDTCGRKGKLKQSLPLLGEVKHFCDISCLLQFCSSKAATQGKVPKPVTEEATPIIANVVSLAGKTTGRSRSSDRLAKKSAASNSQSTVSGDISVQTETTRTLPPPSPLPPSSQKVLKNKALLCKPLVQNKGVSCKTQTVDVEAQTEDIYPKMMILPVPVPVYVPVPMAMYSQCTPEPMGLPLPLPVPMFLPVTMDSAERVVETIQEIKQKIPSDPYEAELILMAEMVAEQEEKNNRPKTRKENAEGSERRDGPAAEDHVSNYSDDLDTQDLENFLNDWEDTPAAAAATQSPDRTNAADKLHPVADVSAGKLSEPSPEPPPRSPPAPPGMDVEADFTVETLEEMARLRDQPPKPPSPPPAAGRRRQAHRKAREKRGRKQQRSSKSTDVTPQKVSSRKTVTPENQKLRSQYGIDAWKRWIRWKKTQPDTEKPRYSRRMELKEDILHCTTAELSYGLCCFIKEVKRPNGVPYDSDSLFYLCLGIQQYLFENGRVENIFMDRFYSKFSNDFTNMLRDFKPSITASGYIHSRVEEEFLWDCKQLGAYSPIVLLNTLLFFCCKYFGFTTVEEHRQLSFAHVMRCTKTNANQTKTTFLRFYPPLAVTEAEADLEVIAAKRRKEEETKEETLEMMENTENPLRCPVRLYEFYLSKCSDSVKQRTNLFYLHPERCCVPNSPLWFSSTPLDDGTMEAMLVRILTVRELHVSRQKKGKATHKDPPFLPEQEEEEEEEDSE